jgi:hypothetical protein
MRPGREETLMKPINCIMEEGVLRLLIRTFRLDRDLTRHQAVRRGLDQRCG